MWYFLRAPRRKASGMTFEDQYGSEKAGYFTVWSMDSTSNGTLAKSYQEHVESYTKDKSYCTRRLISTRGLVCFYDNGK